MFSSFLRVCGIFGKKLTRVKEGLPVVRQHKPYAEAQKLLNLILSLTALKI